MHGVYLQGYFSGAVLGHGFGHLVVKLVHEVEVAELVDEPGDLREEDVEAAIAVEAEEEEQIGGRFVPTDPELLCFRELLNRVRLDEVEDRVVLFLLDEARNNRRPGYRLLHRVGQPRVPLQGPYTPNSVTRAFTQIALKLIPAKCST